MVLKYQEDFSEIIATALENKKIHYREIRRCVENILGYKLKSDNKLLKCLSDMVNDELLTKYDRTGKRGTKVFYSLTDKGRRKHQLKILGTDTRTQKRIALYQLLIFFEAFKRGNLLSKRQFSVLLKKIGSSIDRLERLQNDKQSISSNVINFKPINEIEIIAIVQHPQKTRAARTYYYVVIRGFSVEEFFMYLRLLKFGIEPKPFTPYPAILQIPFVSYTSFTKKELLSAVETLKKYGLIERDTSIPSEKRFRIRNENLRHLIYSVWLVQILDVHLLHLRLIHKKPSMRDKEYLKSYMNEEIATKLRNLAYDIRHNKQAPEDLKKSISLIENSRAYIIREIQEKYNDIIKKDEVISELIEEICFSPFISNS
jgi:DNA-binding PadR family transcriptional regulator